MLLKERLYSLLSLIPEITTSPASRESFHNRRLHSLVRHASRHVPFYRDLYRQEGFQVSTFRGLVDLHELPISSKPQMQRRETHDLLMEGSSPDRLFKRQTSGSTGRFLTICNSAFEESLLSCIRAMALSRIGLRPYQKTARIQMTLPSRRPPAWIRGLQAGGLFRQTVIDCFLEPPEMLSQLQEASADVVSGLPGILALVADELRGEGLPGLKCLIVGGETLTPVLRERIEQSFRAPVFDTYASHEFVQIAVQCPHSRNLHICEEAVLVEVLDGAGQPVEPGESGEIVVTGLHSFMMPFIRFRLGDIVRLGPMPCECGARVKTLSRIEGRTADFLVIGSRKVHFFKIMKELQSSFEWISQYRFRQDRNGKITFSLVPNRHPETQEIEKAHHGIARVLGPRSQFQIEFVSHISPNPSGKFDVCRSELWESHQYDQELRQAGGDSPGC